MSSAPDPADDRELLAAELALDLLDGEERAAAGERLATDPAFAAAHLRWQHHAAALFDRPGETPPDAVWRAVAGRLFARDEAGARAVSRLRWWQGLAAASAVAAIALALHPLRAPEPPRRVVVVRPAPPPLVAVLNGTGRAGVVTVSIYAAHGRLFVRAAALDPGRGDAELWVVPASGKPLALGLIDPATRRALPLAAATGPVLAPGATLAVSLEPKGGSPTGLPTGPVILTGKISES